MTDRVQSNDHTNSCADAGLAPFVADVAQDPDVSAEVLAMGDMG